MFRPSKSYPTHPLDIPEGSVRRRGYRHHVSVTEEGDYDNNGQIRPSGKPLSPFHFHLDSDLDLNYSLWKCSTSIMQKM